MTIGRNRSKPGTGPRPAWATRRARYSGPADIRIERISPGSPWSVPQFASTITPRRTGSPMPVPGVYPDATTATRAACGRAARLGYTVATVSR